MTAPLTVLVAEDEPTVAALVSRMLRDEGHTVLTASDGAAALALLQSGTPVDLLLADIRMPRMSGDQLAFRAKEEGLVRHVLFMTGYDARPETAQMLGPILGKPFSPGDLSRAIGALFATVEARVAPE